MNFLRLTTALLITGSGALGLSVTAATAEARRPNLGLIVADDLGWKDVGYNGSDFSENPPGHL